jgi:hypothetical protein
MVIVVVMVMAMVMVMALIVIMIVMMLEPPARPTLSFCSVPGLGVCGVFVCCYSGVVTAVLLQCCCHSSVCY